MQKYSVQHMAIYAKEVWSDANEGAFKTIFIVSKLRQKGIYNICCRCR